MVLHQQVPMIPEETTSSNLGHLAQGLQEQIIPHPWQE